MTREWRSYAEHCHWWGYRWMWICPHGYSHHNNQINTDEFCPETDARYRRRRWWECIPGGEAAYLFLAETVPSRIAHFRGRFSHCAGANGGKYGRGLRCNCRRCPGSAGGPYLDRRPCRACDKEAG